MEHLRFQHASQGTACHTMCKLHMLTTQYSTCRLDVLTNQGPIFHNLSDAADQTASLLVALLVAQPRAKQNSMCRMMHVIEQRRVILELRTIQSVCDTSNSIVPPQLSHTAQHQHAAANPVSSKVGMFCFLAVGLCCLSRPIASLSAPCLCSWHSFEQELVANKLRKQVRPFLSFALTPLPGCNRENGTKNQRKSKGPTSFFYLRGGSHLC